MAYDQFVGAFVDKRLRDLLVEQAERERTTLSHQIREILTRALNEDHDADTEAGAGAV